MRTYRLSFTDSECLAELHTMEENDILLTIVHDEVMWTVMGFKIEEVKVDTRGEIQETGEEVSQTPGGVEEPPKRERQARRRKRVAGGGGEGPGKVSPVDVPGTQPGKDESGT